MTTTKNRKAARTRKTARRGARLPQALALLTKDHKAVDTMFRRYERMAEDDEERGELLASICKALTAHATLEEELFYPELRAALDEDDTDGLDEATVEHATIKNLVTELEGAEPDDELVSAKVKVLAEYVRHHVREEEGEIFPRAKRAKGFDLDALGERMRQRHDELRGEIGVEEEPSSQARGRRRGAAAARVSARTAER